jgi:PIN domain nuclease of toxin-antitoxin system
MGIKVAQGRLNEFGDLFSRGARDVEQALDDSGIALLVPQLADALRSAALPRHHLDPFDRMIISQAQADGLTIVTRDRMFAKYGVTILPA